MKIFAKKIRLRTIILLILAVVILLSLIFAFDKNLKIARYKITSNKIEESIKIVQISDLHNEIFGEAQEVLIDKVKNEKPDLIVLTGDMADGSPILGTELLLMGIQDVAPIYYVTGNHEYPLLTFEIQNGEYMNILSLMEKYGVEVLSDEIREISTNGNNILIAGVKDPDALIYERAKTHNELKNTFRDVTVNEHFSILLAHRPEKYEEYADYGFDLVLSGHTHGGQVRIPVFVNGLFAPNQGWFPEKAGGLYVLDNKYSDDKMNLIVNRGATLQEFNYEDSVAPRIFNPPEVCVIEIHSD